MHITDSPAPLKQQLCGSPARRPGLCYGEGNNKPLAVSDWGGKRKRALHCKFGFLFMAQYFLG